MGISAELFRIRIGNFNKIKIRKIKYSSRDQMLNVRHCKINKSFLLIFSVLLLYSSTNYRHSINNCTRAEGKVSVISEKVEWQNITSYFYSWAQSGLSINKIQKIINGNRRSVFAR